MQNIRGPLILRIMEQRAQSQRFYSCLSASNQRTNVFLKKDNMSNVRQMSLMASIQEKYLSLATDFIVWISKLPPTTYIQDGLCFFHDNLGISWWACIVGSSILLRVFFMGPANIVSQKTVAKRVLLREEMDKVLVPELKKKLDAKVFKERLSEMEAQAYFRRSVNEMYRSKVIEYNCAAAKTFLPIVLQIPVWVFTTAAIRNLVFTRHQSGSVDSSERLLQLSQGGCLWFDNLMVPDSTFLIPIAVTIAFLAASETTVLIHYRRVMPNKSLQTQTTIRNILWRLVAIMMGVMSSMLPSAITLYWLTSGSSAVFSNLLLMHPPLRRLLRIPLIPSEPQRPYSLIVENFFLRLNKQKEFFKSFSRTK